MPRIARYWRIAALFFIHAFAGGAFHTRIPDLQLQLGLSEGELGFTLMGQPAGALMMFLFSSQIIAGLGMQRTLLVLLPLMALTPALIPLVPTATAMFVLMTINGACFSITNIAMNVEADRVEASGTTRILTTCHGLWSIGFLLTAMIGAMARGLDISPLVHLWALMPVVLLALAFIVIPMRPAPERPHAGGAKSRLAWPTLATLGLVAFGIGASLTEGGVRTWSIIFMRDVFAVPAFIETLPLPAVLLAMALCRLVADQWIDRFGPVRMARALTLLAISGLALVVLSPNYGAALAGFGLIGVGICVSFPLMLSAAARLGDRPAPENVAATTVIIQSASLFAPVAMGWIAEGFGMRVTFAALMPLLILSLVMAGRLEPRTPIARPARA